MSNWAFGRCRTWQRMKHNFKPPVLKRVRNPGKAGCEVCTD